MTEAANNHRLAPPAGLLVDHERPIGFRFEGKTSLAAEHNTDDVP